MCIYPYCPFLSWKHIRIRRSRGRVPDGKVKAEMTEEDKASNGRLLGRDADELSGHPALAQNSLDSITTNMTKDRHRLDDPKAWRWVIVAGLFISTFFQGIEKSMSIYYVEMMEYFETGSSVMSSIGSIYYASYCFSGIITMPMSNRFGPRVMVFTGGVFLSIGLMASAFATNVYLCIACFGFFLGTGFSMSYLNAATVIMFNFEKKRAIAQVIILSGLATGGIIIPIIAQYLNEKYNWRGALIVFSGVTLNVCACGALIRPTPEERTAKLKIQGQCGNHSCLVSLKSFLVSLKEIITSRAVVLLWIQSAFYQGSLSIMTVHMKPTILQKTDASDEMGSYVISFYGGAFCLGLLLTGIVTHVTNIENIVLLEMGTFMCGLGMIVIPAFKNFWVIVSSICIFAFFTTTVATFTPIVLCQLVGTENLRVAWAIRYAFAGIGGLAGPAVAGFLFDTTQNYSNSMLLGGSAIIFSVLIMIEPSISIYRKSRLVKKTILDSEKKDEMRRSVRSLPGSTAEI